MQAVGGWHFCEQKMIRSVVRDDIRGCACLHYLIWGVNWGEHTVSPLLLRSAETWMITRTCAVMATELTVLDFPEGSLFCLLCSVWRGWIKANKWASQAGGPPALAWGLRRGGKGDILARDLHLAGFSQGKVWILSSFLARSPALTRISAFI